MSNTLTNQWKYYRYHKTQTKIPIDVWTNEFEEKNTQRETHTQRERILNTKYDENGNTVSIYLYTNIMQSDSFCSHKTIARLHTHFKSLNPQ